MIQMKPSLDFLLSLVKYGLYGWRAYKLQCVGLWATDEKVL